MGKLNGNNEKQGDYYLGLDIGTDSVGWAVTDTGEDYNILKFRGNLMQGVRLFEQAETAADRRAKRTNRRRLARRKWRLHLLESLFSSEIAKIDPYFFLRLKNSFLAPEDKDENIKTAKYTLFNDKDFTDADYMKKYPTVYHLRDELVKSKEPQDIRRVYLAIRSFIKNRGHFLYDGAADFDDITVENSLEELMRFVEDNYGISLSISKDTSDILADNTLNLTNKYNKLKNCFAINSESEELSLDAKYIAEILAGKTTDLAKLFCNENYKGVKVKLSDDLEEKYDELSSVIGDDIELIEVLKQIFDCAKMKSVLGSNSYICEVKKELYEKNKADLKRLKEFVKANCMDKYHRIFRQSSSVQTGEKNEGDTKNSQDKNLNNYAAYSKNGGEHVCTQEEFCAFLKKELDIMKDFSDYKDMWAEIEEKTFLTRLSSKDNGLIPYQLGRRELKKIIENAATYLPFLNESDEYGSVAEKILSIFDFKIPYYVGPLNSSSNKAWAVRKLDGEKIYPWNFSEVIDLDASANEFMKKLIGRCEYTGEPVLPKDSLLYSEFSLLNEINPLKVNGTPIDVKTKQMIVEDLFIKENKNVSLKTIKNYLVSHGIIKAEDVVSGIDINVKTKLKSHHEFKRILETYNDKAMVEEIIQGIIVYGEDKKLLRNWLKKNYSQLSEEDIKYICRLKYTDWGRFSKEFLTEIYAADENGEAFNIIEMLRNKNLNLNQILSDKFNFMSYAQKYKNERYTPSESIKQRLDDMYISPSTRRAVLQAVKITDEIVDIMKGAPKKIFIEVAREHDPNRGRSETRKDILLKLYEECGEKDSELYQRLVNTDNLKLRKDTVYLYFLQLGKCMYSEDQTVRVWVYY